MYNSVINNKSNKDKKAISYLFLLALSLFSLLNFPEANAQGNLLITPRRIVFDGSRRVMELNLANTGQDTSKYNVSIVQYRMTDDGAFEEITEPAPGQNFADKYIRFFPRTVILAPNESQVVKMQVTNTSNLAPGEYRSHVYFRAVPKETALGEEDPNRDTTALSIKLVPIFGITIPVIIRIGQSDTKVSISDLKLETVNDTTNRLSMVFNRTGNMSVYGDLRITHISPSGKESIVGIVNGIAVYTPNTIRRFNLDLDNSPKADFKTGKIRVTYSSQSDTHPEKYSETELTIQ
ncbi:MAG: hypothetical protein VB022_00515 [Rikenellaceae bacterium]|nr:hypothetical protein [Rikenellaceae bacterium]